VCAARAACIRPYPDIAPLDSLSRWRNTPAMAKRPLRRVVRSRKTGSVLQLQNRPAGAASLPDRLVARRLALGLTQGEVAQRAPSRSRRGDDKSLSRSGYTDFELGKVDPTVFMVEMLAKVLECTPEWLAFGVGPEPEIATAFRPVRPASYQK
jgi:hypothetical protein